MMWQKSGVISKYYRLKHLFRFANTLPTHIHPQSRSSKLSSRFCIFSVFEFPAYLPMPTTTLFPKIQKPKNFNFPPPPSNPQLSPLLVVFPDKTRLPNLPPNRQLLPRGHTSRHGPFSVPGEAVRANSARGNSPCMLDGRRCGISVCGSCCLGRRRSSAMPCMLGVGGW